MAKQQVITYHQQNMLAQLISLWTVTFQLIVYLMEVCRLVYTTSSIALLA
jgi:hypothetical protein